LRLAHHGRPRVEWRALVGRQHQERDRAHRRNSAPCQRERTAGDKRERGDLQHHVAHAIGVPLNEGIPWQRRRRERRQRHQRGRSAATPQSGDRDGNGAGETGGHERFARDGHRALEHLSGRD
jgi:hypothetical protein